jgi:hypothetical protein
MVRYLKLKRLISVRAIERIDANIFLFLAYSKTHEFNAHQNEVKIKFEIFTIRSGQSTYF